MSETNPTNNKILVLFAHPAQHYSHANVAMRNQISQNENITFVDLYAKYPRFQIDIDDEQNLLLGHDMVVFQFPIYWYSSPAMLKEWQDHVLEYGFAFGEGGTNLRGKKFMLAVTAGTDQAAYAPDGGHKHGLTDFLIPFSQMAKFCQMDYQAPFVLFESIKAQSTGGVDQHAKAYEQLLNGYATDNANVKKLQQQDFIIAEDVFEMLGEGA